MADSLLSRQGNSKKTLLLLSLLFSLCLLVVIIFAYGLARLTRESIIENRDLSYAPPQEAVKDQVKRILLRRQGENGIEYLEILEDGTVNLYDANMKLIKSGLQGFGRITNLFKNFEQYLMRGDKSFQCPAGYEITIFTNLGSYTCSAAATNNPAPNVDDQIDEIEDIVDDTLTPTPTRKPSPTPPPGISPKTPTPTITYLPPTPRVTDPDWNPLTPTPLPDYMTAPPFSCKDYQLNHPYTISNVICGAD